MAACTVSQNTGHASNMIAGKTFSIDGHSAGKTGLCPSGKPFNDGRICHTSAFAHGLQPIMAA